MNKIDKQLHAKNRQINVRFSETQGERIIAWCKISGIKLADGLRVILDSMVSEIFIDDLTPDGDLSGNGGTQFSTYLRQDQLDSILAVEKRYGFSRNQLFRYLYDYVAGGMVGKEICALIRPMFRSNTN